MGFLSQMLVPRSVRRAMHPARTVKRAVTPKTIKRAGRALRGCPEFRGTSVAAR